MVYLFKSRTSLSKDRFTVCFWHSNQAELILHDEYIGIEPMTSKSYSLQEPQSCAFDQLRHTATVAVAGFEPAKTLVNYFLENNPKPPSQVA